MARANSNPITKPTALLNAVARIHLSRLFQDSVPPRGLQGPDQVDNPRTLDGAAAVCVVRPDRLADGVDARPDGRAQVLSRTSTPEFRQ